MPNKDPPHEEHMLLTTHTLFNGHSSRVACQLLLVLQLARQFNMFDSIIYYKCEC